MKVIGVIPTRWSDKRFIVEIHVDEIAKLLGHCYANGHINELEVGSEIKIAEMWAHLAGIATLSRETTQVRNSLLKAAELLNGFPDPLKQIEIGPDKPEAKPS